MIGLVFLLAFDALFWAAAAGFSLTRPDGPLLIMLGLPLAAFHLLATAYAARRIQ